MYQLRKSILCFLACITLLSQNLLVSAAANDRREYPIDNSIESVLDILEPKNIIEPGDQASIYLSASNSSPVEVLSFYNLDGKKTLRVDFDETSGPTKVFMVIQQKEAGSNYFTNVPNGSKTLSVGDSIRVVNLSSDVNTEIRVMAQWIAGASGRATFSFYLT